MFFYNIGTTMMNVKLAPAICPRCGRGSDPATKNGKAMRVEPAGMIGPLEGKGRVYTA